jgi:hypothetical protein
VRPLSWIVIAGVLTMALLGARAVSARRGSVAASAEVHTEEPAAPVPPPAPPRFSHAAAPAPRPPRPDRLVHLRGRVVVPAGTDLDDQDLAVTADDGENEYPAAVSKDGRFELHLPPRTYTLTASMGDLVGMKEGVSPPAGGEDLTIPLEAAVAIEGSIGPGRWGRRPSVEVTRAGNEISSGRVDASEGRFVVSGLVRGARYDVEITDRGRKALLRDVVAPATVQIPLPALVTVRGQIGFEPGTRCPFKSVSLTADEGNDHPQERVDGNCHFKIEDVERGKVQLRATGPGWHAEGAMVIPAEGDPDTVCLNPPCGDLPPVEPASLRVILTGAPGDTSMVAQVRQEDGGDSCNERGSCLIRDLTPGAKSTLSVWGSGHACDEVIREITLVSGPNVVSVPCLRTRVVEGVARGGDRQPAVVSCKSGEEVALRDSVLFQIRCPAEATELRYRSGNRPWHTAALPAGLERAFVELTL